MLQSEALDPKLTVIDTMVQAAPDAKMNDIKSLLGRMMFSGKSMEKSVSICGDCACKVTLCGSLGLARCLSGCCPSDSPIEWWPQI